MFHVEQFPVARSLPLRLESRAMISEACLRELLAPFGILLTSGQTSQLNTYLDLLIAWNRRINLTSVRNPEECVTRHFGESLFLSRKHTLKGPLLDVGSGAGFPGLALKIVFPELAPTLLEPIAKKRAFLKEVVRACGFTNVEVRPERLAAYSLLNPQARFDAATSRAVGDAEEIVRLLARCLSDEGKIFLWLGEDQAVRLIKNTSRFIWQESMPVPLSRKRQIIRGTLKTDCQ